MFLCEFHKVYTFLVFVLFITCKSKKSVDFFLLSETHFLKQYLLKYKALILKYVPCIFSFLPCGFYALKISFQFLARKKAFFPVRFSLVLYVFYSRQLGFLFKICGSLVFVSCQGKRSYSSSMPYSLSRPANSSTSSRACSYVTSNSSVSRRAISSSVKPPFSIICQM